MTAFVTLRDARIAYEIWGEGPPLLLIHGAEGSRRSFDKVVPELERDFTVITYDQRDCGETENPEAMTSVVDLADDANELISLLGYSTCFVFGTSFGGRVAQALAIRYPAVARRLILASTWQLSLALADLNPDVAAEVSTLRGGLPESAERLAPYFFPEAFLKDQPQHKQYFSKAKRRSERSARRAHTVGGNPDLDLGAIECATLLVAGELDRLVPPRLTLSMRHKLKSTEEKILPGVGHISCIQAPEAIAQHIKQFCLQPDGSAPFQH